MSVLHFCGRRNNGEKQCRGEIAPRSCTALQQGQGAEAGARELRVTKRRRAEVVMTGGDAGVVVTAYTACDVGGGKLVWEPSGRGGTGASGKYGDFVFFGCSVDDADLDSRHAGADDDEE